jgi:ArsR family transcriptional regulator
MDFASPQNADGGLPAEVFEISRDEINRRLRDPALIVVDVLPQEAYAAEHISGAINLPLAEVEKRAPQLLPDRNAEIATYCAKFT